MIVRHLLRAYPYMLNGLLSAKMAKNYMLWKGLAMCVEIKFSKYFVDSLQRGGLSFICAKLRPDCIEYVDKQAKLHDFFWERSMVKEARWTFREMVFLLLAASTLLEVLVLYQYVIPHDGQAFFDRDPVGADFIVFWSAAVLAVTDRLPEIFDYQKFHEVQTMLLDHEYQLRLWHYPPYFLFYLTPLAWFSYIPAYVVWNVVTFVGYAWTMIASRPRALMVFALVVAPATFVNILCGQNGFLSAALFVGGMLLLKQHPMSAGFLFGLLAYKPHIGILVPIIMVAERNWKALISAIVTCMSLVIASVIFHGLDIWRLYATETMINTGIVLEKVTGFLTYMMPTVFMSGRLLGFEESTNYMLQGVVMLSVLVATYWAVRRTTDIKLRTAIACVGVFLVSPYAYNYDMTIVSAAIALIVEIGENSGFLPGEGVVLALTWFLPIGVILLNAMGAPIAPVIVGMLFLLLLVRANRSSMNPDALVMN